ncbi:MAG: 3'(2'),5'-bisphosphate nucleotidase [bacterium]
MKSGLNQEKEAGIESAIKAASLCRKVQREMVGLKKEGALEKSDRSPVTVADYGAQAIICHALKEAFPDVTIVAEENSSLLRLPENRHLLDRTTSFVEQILEEEVGRQQVCDWIDLGCGQPGHRFWTLDPIDGTKGFLRGDQYAVALAFVVDRKVQFGILACPNLSFRLPSDRAMDKKKGDSSGSSGSLYVGEAGEGAYMMSLDRRQVTPLHVSATDDPARARFIESFEPSHADLAAQQKIAQSLRNGLSSIRMDSQTKYGMLARGAADVYLRLPSPETPDYREKIWDHAAGSLIVEEAGGVVTDIHGTALDFGLGKKLSANQGIVATNGKIHSAVIEAIQASY